jgi:hypothetical protein
MKPAQPDHAPWMTGSESDQQLRIDSVEPGKPRTVAEIRSERYDSNEIRDFLLSPVLTMAPVLQVIVFLSASCD